MVERRSVAAKAAGSIPVTHPKNYFMQISQKQLEEYKKIYKSETGEDLSDQEALDQASKLLRLMEIVYKPITKE